MAVQPALRDSRANQAYQDVMMPLRVARQRAIAERKQYIVCFGVAAPAGALTSLGAPTAQSIQTFRWDTGTALSAAVQISAYRLPADLTCGSGGVAEQCGHSADGFGTAAVAIDFDQGVGGGIKNQVMFMPDGSAHNVNGNWNSGIVYVLRPWGSVQRARGHSLRSDRKNPRMAPSGQCGRAQMVSTMSRITTCQIQRNNRNRDLPCSKLSSPSWC